MVTALAQTRLLFGPAGETLRCHGPSPCAAWACPWGARLELLKPMAADCRRHEEISASERELLDWRDCLEALFARLKIGLLEERLTRLTGDREKLAAAVGTLIREKENVSHKIADIKSSIARNGGERLEKLAIEIRGEALSGKELTIESCDNRQSEVRVLFASARFFLIDRATCMAHMHFCVREPSPCTRSLGRLTEVECGLYRDLRENQLGHQLRLEQERIAFHHLKEELSNLENGFA